MRKVLFLMIFAISLLGCSQQESKGDVVTVFGESENWNANIKYIIEKQGEDELFFDEGKIEYKHKYFPKEVKYEFSYPIGVTSSSKGSSETPSTSSTNNYIKLPKSGGGKFIRDTQVTLEQQLAESYLMISWS